MVVRSGSGDGALAVAGETGHVLYSVRRRGRNPLSTAARLTSLGGYFATSASRFASA